MCFHSTLQPWRWVCDPLPLFTRPDLPSFRGSEVTVGHGQTHQHQIRDRRHFGSTLTPECWLGDKNKTKKSKWLANYCSLLKMKDNYTIYHNPCVRKPATEMHKWHVLCSLQNLLTPLSPLSLFNPSAKRKRLEVYLLYFLMIALWCKMCRKYLLLSLKTLESLHTHCELGKSVLSFYLSPCIRCHRNGLTQDWGFVFYSVATFLNNVLLCPMPTFLFKET